MKKEMDNFLTTIHYIIDRSVELKNRFTDQSKTSVEFACIFCQNEGEYKKFTNLIENLGKAVEETQSGFTYFLDEPIKTIAGPLRLVKIRKPDLKRSERGDVDFNTDYHNFKKHFLMDPGFELIKRGTFEMLRLSNPNFDVMACFSNIPKSKDLGIKL